MYYNVYTCTYFDNWKKEHSKYISDIVESLLIRCGRLAKLSKTMTIAENTGTIDICESLVLRNSWILTTDSNT